MSPRSNLRHLTSRGTRSCHSCLDHMPQEVMVAVTSARICPPESSVLGMSDAALSRMVSHDLCWTVSASPVAVALWWLHGVLHCAQRQHAAACAAK
eukprot:8162054-Alexandrium_andersonii.AAC.1